MTDEEMAEQYAQNLEKELMKEYEEHPEYGQTPYLATIPTPHAKQAFLAGLKAGRPQWHYVKDGDLPDEDIFVYLWFKGLEYPTVARRRLFKKWGRLKWCWDCKWGSGYTIEADKDRIIAWREIVPPKEIE